MARCVVTGGGGFIGAYLVRKLVHDGWDVVCVDNMLRGDQSRFADVADEVDLQTCDVRDADAVPRASTPYPGHTHCADEIPAPCGSDPCRN